ncbi:MAG: PAS domain S-box protein [Gemmatimonadaceae bacterium]
MKCDVWSFEQALAQRDLEGAASHYGGPFLQYFGIRGAPEFDHWIDSERSRQAQRFQQLVVTLAERSAERGDHARAINWWRVLVEQDPLSALAAGGLVSALAAAGDRPSALTYGREYEARVRSELGLPLEPRIVKLMQDLDRSVPVVPLITGSQVTRLLDEEAGAMRYTRNLGGASPTGRAEQKRPGVKRRKAGTARDGQPGPTREELAYRRIFDAAADAIYSADLEGRFTSMNPAGAKMLGLPLAQIIGRPFTDFVRDDLRHVTVDFYSRQVDALTPVTYYEFPLAVPAGATIWLGQHVSLTPPGESPTGIVAIARDITLTKRLQRRRSYLSVRDRTTNLLNAAAFRVMVDHRIALARRIKKGFLLVFVAVENAGDVLSGGGVDLAEEMLALVAEALRSTFRASDLIGRLAVDKFAVLAVDASEADIEVLEKRFLSHLERLHDPSVDTPWPRVVASAAYYDPALPPSIDALFGSPSAPGEA